MWAGACSLPPSHELRPAHPPPAHWDGMLRRREGELESHWRPTPRNTCSSSSSSNNTTHDTQYILLLHPIMTFCSVTQYNCTVLYNCTSHCSLTAIHATGCTHSSQMYFGCRVNSSWGGAGLRSLPPRWSSGWGFAMTIMGNERFNMCSFGTQENSKLPMVDLPIWPLVTWL